MLILFIGFMVITPNRPIYASEGTALKAFIVHLTLFPDYSCGPSVFFFFPETEGKTEKKKKKTITHLFTGNKDRLSIVTQSELPSHLICPEYFKPLTTLASTKTRLGAKY